MQKRGPSPSIEVSMKRTREAATGKGSWEKRQRRTTAAHGTSSKGPGPSEQPQAKAQRQQKQSEEDQAASSSGSEFWPYPTDYLDHFETSVQALRDVEPALYRLASHLSKPKSELVVYDPYFCKGAIREHYKEIGITRLIHEKRDFYADIKKGRVPEYDILVTNPPYSGDHKERILQFCMDSRKPWALLMPNYVANKQYFKDLVAHMMSHQQPQKEGAPASHGPFFLAPEAKYEYEHPEGTGHSSSPFHSIWFIHLGSHTGKVQGWWQKLLSKPSKGSKVKLLRSVDDLQESQVVPTWKRPNPKQRNKLKKMRKQATDEHGDP